MRFVGEGDIAFKAILDHREKDPALTVICGFLRPSDGKHRPKKRFPPMIKTFMETEES